jgi:hypothetical protein
MNAQGIGGIKWHLVQKWARLGNSKEDIIAALAVSAETLRDPEVVSEFARVMQQGEALHRISLTEDVDRLRNGGPGKVNAVLASLRQKLNWNRPDSSGAQASAKPDTDAAVAEIAKMLKRFKAP